MDPLRLFENLISQHAHACYPIKLKNSLPDLDLNPGRKESSARQPSMHCGVLTVV